MFKDKEKLYQAYHAMLSMALTWAFVLVINQYFQLKVPVIFSAFYALVPSVLIYLFDINKKNIVSYLLLGSILPMLAFIFWIVKVNPIHWFYSLTDWCMSYDGTQELYKAAHANTVVFLTALFGAVIFYLLTRTLLAKILLAAALIAAMIVLSVGKVDINKAVVGICIFYIMTILVELYGIIYSRKAGKPEKKEGILYLAPICLILSVLAILLPSKPEPIEWKAFKNMYKNVKEQVEILQTNLNYYFGNAKSEFFVNLTGYSDNNGKLDRSTSLIKDEKVAMKVSGLDKGKTVYLTGSVSDIYSGNSWEKSKQDYLPGEEEYLLDYEEMLYALARQDANVLENNSFLERRTIRVIYNNIKTKTFFYPLKMCWYSVNTSYKKLSKETPQINFGKARGRGTTYQLFYYEMNLEGEAFIQMLREADSFSYANANEQRLDKTKLDYVLNHELYQDNINDEDQKQSYYNLLGQRADMIKKNYTSLPEQLPDRVYELAKQITAGCNTKYDKLRAIEEYLSANYTYTLQVTPVPKGQDFTDYFLFDSKQGYCTYYATAMAVLGRCVGIPTRYVEGFLGKFNVRDDEYRYLIKNSQAHAWAEAYIEGVGWIPFEATTPFYSNRYTEWPNLNKTQTTVDNGAVVPFPSYQPQLPSQNLPVTEEVVRLEKNNYGEIISGIIILLSIILILLLVVMIYYFILRYRYRKTFDRADYSTKMYMLFLRILRQLKREGYELGQQETILMLAERVKETFKFGTITFPVIADIFMRYRYAEEKITKEDYECTEKFLTGLADKEKSEVNRFQLWLEEFVFLARKSSYERKQ